MKIHGSVVSLSYIFPIHRRIKNKHKKVVGRASVDAFEVLFHTSNTAERHLPGTNFGHCHQISCHMIRLAVGGVGVGFIEGNEAVTEFFAAFANSARQTQRASMPSCRGAVSFLGLPCITKNVEVRSCL